MKIAEIKVHRQIAKAGHKVIGYDVRLTEVGLQILAHFGIPKEALEMADGDGDRGQAERGTE